ncbi:MAG: rhodanese-like domain-containing protein [Candidatus Malihini olakiniferum]
MMVDIRDAQNYPTGHVPQTVHLTNETLSDFMRDAELNQPVILMYYQGISSHNAGQCLKPGFDQCIASRGGFEAWQRLPQVLPRI